MLLWCKVCHTTFYYSMVHSLRQNMNLQICSCLSLKGTVSQHLFESFEHGLQWVGLNLTQWELVLAFLHFWKVLSIYYMSKYIFKNSRTIKWLNNIVNPTWDNTLRGKVGGVYICDRKLTKSKQIEKSKSHSKEPLKGTQEWEFFWLRFWILYYFIVSYVKILRFCKKTFWLA